MKPDKGRESVYIGQIQIALQYDGCFGALPESSEKALKLLNVVCDKNDVDRF